MVAVATPAASSATSSDSPASAHTQEPAIGAASTAAGTGARWPSSAASITWWAMWCGSSAALLAITTTVSRRSGMRRKAVL